LLVLPPLSEELSKRSSSERGATARMGRSGTWKLMRPACALSTVVSDSAVGETRFTMSPLKETMVFLSRPLFLPPTGRGDVNNVVSSFSGTTDLLSPPRGVFTASCLPARSEIVSESARVLFQVAGDDAVVTFPGTRKMLSATNTLRGKRDVTSIVLLLRRWSICLARAALLHPCMTGRGTRRGVSRKGRC